VKKPKAKRESPVYLIQWKDNYHFADASWRDKYGYDSIPVFCETVGWLAHESGEAVTLVGTRADGGRMSRGDQTILRVNIVTKRELKIK